MGFGVWGLGDLTVRPPRITRGIMCKFCRGLWGYIVITLNPKHYMESSFQMPPGDSDFGGVQSQRRRHGSGDTWAFPKIRGAILGVPIIRIIVYWGPYWGPPILGNYHLGITTLRVQGLKEWGLRAQMLSMVFGP